MKPTIDLRLGQQPTLTPQLQTAIRLLQLSTTELVQEIQQMLDANPMLEYQDEMQADELGDEDAALHPAETAKEMQLLDESTEIDLQNFQQITEDLPVDTSWDEIYQEPVSTGAPAEPQNLDWQTQKGVSLQEHLMWQMELTPFTAIEKAIAIAIIDSINEDGLLGASLEDIQNSLGSLKNEVTIADIEGVLCRIQDFDPAGIGGRNLQESLLLQLRQKPEATPWLTEAIAVVEQHIHLLAKHDYSQLQQRMHLSQEQLQSVIQLIQSLNPRPGSQISKDNTAAVIPDIIVRKTNEKWLVELNLNALPKLGINHRYAQLVQRANNESDNLFLRNQLQEARWFLKSIQSRHETLLKVATCIVEYQRGFLEYGAEAMRPLVLREVAEALGVHESTISRITTQKYMLTPQGVFELKYFFSSHVMDENGQECSSTAIRAFIKKLIAAENSKRPLSDSKIAQILAEQGFNVARRTVAKYREAMAIPASKERKYLT